MLLTERIKLLVSADQQAKLTALLRAINETSNWAAQVAFRKKVFSHRKLRSLVYQPLRKAGWSSGFADLIPRRVANAYSGRTLMERRRRQAGLIKFRAFSAVPLDLRLFSYKRNQKVSILASRAGRILIPFQVRPDVDLSNKKEAKLAWDGKRFLLLQAVERPEAEQQEAEGWLGVDLGIVNVATDSDGNVHSGSKLRWLRRRQNKLRSRLNSKQTKSAKRLLKKRRRKERRFARDVNHQISKKLVMKARDTRRGIALENLKGIRRRIKVRRAQRRELHSWAFGQLRSFVEYKARLAGVPVQLVDPKYTSQTCPHCGHVDKRNRPSQAEFRCIRCGCAGHADTFAAIEIGRRAAGLQPNAAPPLAVVASSETDRSQGHSQPSRSPILRRRFSFREPFRKQSLVSTMPAA